MTTQAIRIATATGYRIVARDNLTAGQSAFCLMSDDERSRFKAWLRSLETQGETP